MDLKELGMQKLLWAKKYMKLLKSFEEELKERSTLEGVRVVVSVHLEAKTANLAWTLHRLGADVVATGSNPLSTQDEIVEALKEQGVKVSAWHTHSMDEYMEQLNRALNHRPQLIIDDGADLSVLVHTERKEVLQELVGISEETTTGVRRDRALEKDGILKVPVIAVNDSKMKYLFDNRYGTGQSTWDGIIRNTNITVAGKTVVVAGYGWCGRGVAMRARGLGARVVVTEVDPVKAAEAVMDGFQVMRMDDAASLGDIFVTTTGGKDVITKRHFEKMKDGAILANAGHFNVEISVEDLESLASKSYTSRPNVTTYVLSDGREIHLLAEGRLVNLAAADGHPIEIMDLSFSLQLLSAVYLWENKGKLEPKVHTLPNSIDEKVARRFLEIYGHGLDELTEEQKKYLESAGA